MKGDVCRMHGCCLCCQGTEMVLTLEDIERISGAGKVDFHHEDTRQLRNIDGRCVFLSNEGNCTIYDIHPRGCRSYPLIMSVPSMEPLIDDLCPYRSEFTFEPEDVLELKELVEILMEEGA
ncbi:MAG: YkgJ family cysteine cluster protein [Candidatus Thermoplasmatota archaeon]|nr:YkgJ family cysteine cluster protein [Candidatus Thermoplasmatota archaeon]